MGESEIWKRVMNGGRTWSHLTNDILEWESNEFLNDAIVEYRYEIWSKTSLVCDWRRTPGDEEKQTITFCKIISLDRIFCTQ
jgi:hypothetical protein